MAVQQLFLSSYGAAAGAPPPTGPITWDPLNKSAAINLTMGNKRATNTDTNGSTWECVRATAPITANSYFEFVMSDTDNTNICGIVTSAQVMSGDTFPGKVLNGAGIGGVNGTIWLDWTNSISVAGPTWGLGDIMGFAVDAAGHLFMSKNGAWILGCDPVTGANPIATLSGTLYPAAAMLNHVGLYSLKASAAEQTYAAPTGYTALDTGDTGPAYRYYRILITANNGHANYAAIAEIELRGVAGGVDYTSAAEASTYGQATASDTESSWGGSQAYAFDNNIVYLGYPSAQWLSNTTPPSPGAPKWVKYDFGSKVVISEFAMIAAHSTETNPSTVAPKDFVVQGSNDNLTWTTLVAPASQTGWAPSEQRLFSWTPAYKAETLAYATAVATAGGSLTTAQKLKIDTFLSALQAKSYGSKVRVFYPQITNKIATAVIPCRDTWSAGPLVNTGFVDADCSDAGIDNTARSAKYLNTGLLPQNLNSGAFSMGIGLKSMTLDGTGTYVEPMGCYDSTAGGGVRGVIDLRPSLRAFRMGANANTASDTTAPTDGRYAGERASSVSRKIYRNGSSLASNTTSDGGFSGSNTRTIHVMCSQQHDGSKWQFQAIGQFAFLAEPLGDTDQADFDALIAAYLVTPFGK